MRNSRFDWDAQGYLAQQAEYVFVQYIKRKMLELRGYHLGFSLMVEELGVELLGEHTQFFLLFVPEDSSFAQIIFSPNMYSMVKGVSGDFYLVTARDLVEYFND